MMAAEKNPAIELLLSQILELEQKTNAFRRSVNVLLAQDGQPPMFPDDGGGGSRDAASATGRPNESGAHTTQIRPDTFYGKAQQTAVRELLAIRKQAGVGPAKPAEILEGLKSGGYQVQAQTDEVALVGLRAMLRKRANIFHKLPNNTWGLKEWYPNAKAARDHAEKGSSASKDNGAANSAQDSHVEANDRDDASAA